MSTDIENSDISSNIDEESKLSGMKTIETMKARNLIMNAILIGIQKAINRRGEAYDIPPSLRMKLLNESQKGGGPFSNLKGARDIYNYKNAASRKLEGLGVDKKTIKSLSKASSLKDVRNIGIRQLKQFGAPPPPPQSFGARTFKNFKNKIGVGSKEPEIEETLNRDDLKRIGIEGLKRSGILRKFGISDEQINNLNPEQVKQIGKEFALEKLEKLKQLKERTGINEALDPNNPDYQKDTGTLAASKIVSNVKNMYVGVVKKIIIVSDFFASKLIDSVTQGALNTPINELSENTNKRVLVLAAYLREIANNPEQLKAISEISESLGVMGIEFIDAIKPSVDKIIDKVIESSKEVGSKAAFGATQTLISIASSIISAVPGIGGVIDLIVSIAMGFNSFMRVVRSFTESNSEVMVEGASALGKTVGTVRKNSSKLMGMIDKIKQGIPNGDEISGQIQKVGENIPIAVPVDREREVDYRGGYRKINSNNKFTRSRKRIENSFRRFKNLNNELEYKGYHQTYRTRKHINL